MAYAQRFAEGAGDHLRAGEEVELALRASVPPTTPVMTVITAVALFGALSLSTGVSSLTLRLTIIVLMVAVIVAAFTAYSAAGFSGPIGPYVVVGLTQHRVLVFRRDLLGRMKGDPVTTDRTHVGAEIRRRMLLLPDRITLTGLTADPLTLDVPRIEPTKAFVAALEE